MKTERWTEWPHWALLGAMFLGAAVTWPRAPERLPVHWGLSGEVDRYGGRFEGLLALPMTALGVYLLLRYLPRLDPGHANYALFSGAYALIRLAVLGVIAALYGLVLITAWGRSVDVVGLVPALVGGLLVVMGSVLGKVRPNWFVGIRTPWTLSSKLAWTKTHRLGGWLLIADGLALIIVAGVLRPAWAPGAVAAVLIGSVLLLSVYSYLVWRTDPDKTPPAGTSPAEEES